jgi:cell division protein FtsB
MGEIIPVLIVAIVMTAIVMKSRYRHLDNQASQSPQERAETLRLREEVKELKERIQVLERITVEKENTLSKQIEELRDR